MMKAKFTSINGIEIHFQEGPSNGEPLLLIHGITNNRTSFNSFIPFLIDKFQLFVIDLRGHGKSQRTPNDYSILTMTKDVEEFITEVISKPCFIYGHSLGGLIGLKLSIKCEKVKSLIIGDMLYLLNREMMKKGGFEFNGRIHKIMNSSTNEIEKLKKFQEIFGDQFGKYYWELGFNELDPGFQEIFIKESQLLDQFYSGFSDDEVKKLIKLISKPVLFLLADPNVMSTVKISQEQEIKELNKSIEVARLKGVSHFLHIDNPKVVGEEIQKFIDK